MCYRSSWYGPGVIAYLAHYEVPYSNHYFSLERSHSVCGCVVDYGTCPAIELGQSVLFTLQLLELMCSVVCVTEVPSVLLEALPIL